MTDEQAAHTRANPPAVMTLEDIAVVLGYSTNYVRNEMQHQPGFPARLARFQSPRFTRDSVMAWALT